MTHHFVSDTTTLLDRSLRHILRSPDTIITTAVTPVAISPSPGSRSSRA